MKSAATQAQQSRIIQAARGWVGTPYMHQASLKAVGCDCLGLLRGVWREIMGPEPLPVPPYSAHWAEQAPDELLLEAATAHLMPINLQDAIAGDVLLFRWRRHLPAMHCGILAEHEQLIHAHEGASVVQVPLQGAWARRASHAFAFPVLAAAKPNILHQQSQGGQG